MCVCGRRVQEEVQEGRGGFSVRWDIRDMDRARERERENKTQKKRLEEHEEIRNFPSSLMS